MKQLGRAGFLMLPHPLTNFEIQSYKKRPKFNGAFQKIIFLK